MKKSWNNSPRRARLVLLALPLALLLGGCQSDKKPPGAVGTAEAPAADAHHHEGAGDVYTCPMHPQIIRDKPGQCPICGMDLVKKPKASGALAPASGTLQNLLNSPDATVVSTQATVYPSASAPDLTLTLTGRVEYDTRRTEVIAARFGGRVEKLLVRYNYQPVSKGQKLLEVYSPQLVTAQQELIFILTNDAENQTLLRGARQKLRLLGLTDAQINQTIATRKPSYSVAIYSPYSGYVVEQPAQPGGALPPPPAPEAGGMNSGGADPMAGGAPSLGSAPVAASLPAEAGLTLTEGAYITAGQTLFRVVNTRQVWGVFEPRPDELAALQVGQPIRVLPENNPARARTARIDLIEPFFREGARTGAVRVHLSNADERLRSGALLTGTVSVPAVGGLWLPRAAVVDLGGNRQVAFVRRGGAFQAVPVQTGRRSAERVQILQGLTTQDAVATNAQFLVDSEGFVQTAPTTNQPQTDYRDE
ncbi:efflux RND transporter periplasmic adaptor subunit [Hymenobacter lutimineralis]|uniref:Efflux RND transporter periplasmic adaptor subunit n=1 Tax=Hymenobacter lutimineralis TaxID=2606448 RepID=A0A5D6UWF0_9BACT|nr:efflux RND transporter periplasmic adaptor subunit [Hymenobacter lutimineralis]TYZ07218.1 efflux RND transporter periplasmic adaptor subunit [Hymenobacter lutimineralis]